MNHKDIKETIALAKTSNLFNTIIEDYAKSDGKSPISGVPYVLSDNITTKDIKSTGGSKFLSEYIPIFDATVYKKLTDAGAILVGKTNINEFNMVNGTNDAFQAVKSDIVPFGITTDTFGSLHKSAAINNIIGFKPTYGRISRFGAFSFSSSMDTIGIIAKSIKDIAVVTDILKGQDEADMQTLKDDNKKYADILENDIKDKKLFYIKDTAPNNKIIETIKNAGFIMEEVEIDKNLLEAIYPAYNIIACAEATTNLANLTGIPFGLRREGNSADEITLNSRTEGLGSIVKRRLVFGEYVLQRDNFEKLFIPAKKIRAMIVNKMNEFFKDYDGMISSINTNEKCEELIENNILDNILAIANLGGYPNISVKGISLTGRVKEDDTVLNIANKLEEIIGKEN